MHKEFNLLNKIANRVDEMHEVTEQLCKQSICNINGLISMTRENCSLFKNK